MSERTHPRLVGAFVLAAVALVVAGVVTLSSGDWFATRNNFSVFFPGSVKGLNPGAPVTFRGVQLGQVKSVDALLTGQEDPLVQIEVILELRADIVEVPEGVTPPFRGLDNSGYAAELIRRGIRARMLSTSLLTGQRYIELDFLPDEPARFGGLRPHFPELPTTPTAIEKLGQRVDDFLEKLAELPFDEMLEDVRTVIKSARQLLDSDDLRGALASADRALGEIPPIVSDVRSTLERFDRLAETLDGEIQTTASSGREAAAELRRTLERAERTLASLERSLNAADETRMDASRSLEELSQTLAVLRNLAEYVQTHPEAVVLGKPDEEAKR
jgi:paraquat-inducible protein B